MLVKLSIALAASIFATSVAAKETLYSHTRGDAYIVNSEVGWPHPKPNLISLEKVTVRFKGSKDLVKNGNEKRVFFVSCDHEDAFVSEDERGKKGRVDIDKEAFPKGYAEGPKAINMTVIEAWRKKMMSGIKTRVTSDEKEYFPATAYIEDYNLWYATCLQVNRKYGR